MVSAKIPGAPVPALITGIFLKKSLHAIAGFFVGVLSGPVRRHNFLTGVNNN
jgi:hypothetical protein